MAKVQTVLSFFGRAVCRWLGVSRSALRYHPKPVAEGKLLPAPVALRRKEKNNNINPENPVGNLSLEPGEIVGPSSGKKLKDFLVNLFL